MRLSIDGAENLPPSNMRLPKAGGAGAGASRESGMRQPMASGRRRR